MAVAGTAVMRRRGIGGSSGTGVALLRDDSAFNIFEIIDNIRFKFADCRFIADNNPVAVHLQNAYRPHVVYAAFNRVAHSAGFFGAGCQNHNFFGVHNRSHANSQSHGRNPALIAVKKARIGLNRIPGQRFYPGAGSQRRRRLVEGNVSVFSHAADKQMDSLPKSVVIPFRILMFSGRISMCLKKFSCIK